MIAPLEGMAAFHRPEIGDVLDHADLAVGAFLRKADIADIRGAQIAAIETFAGGGGDLLHQIREGHELHVALGDQVQDRAARRARAKAGKPGHHVDQGVDVAVGTHRSGAWGWRQAWGPAPTPPEY